MKVNDVSFVLELDRFPPSVNHAYYHIKKGKAFIKVKTKECKEFVDFVHNQFPKTYEEIQNDGKTVLTKDVKPLEGDVDLKIVVTMGDKRKRDLDNFLKILIDSLNGKAFVDDSQIVHIDMRKVMGEAHHLHITVRKTVRNIKMKCTECGRIFNKEEMVYDMKKHLYYCVGCW